MHELITFTITVFMAFFAMMNPIANTAIFVGLTSNETHEVKRKIAIKALVSAFVIIGFCCFLGQAIFTLFGITLAALRLAGGVLVFLIGYHMLNGSPSQIHTNPTESNIEKNDIAISPLALPILAGPGTIATAMSFSASGNMVHIVVTLISFALLSVITFVCFVLGEKLIVRLGANGVSIITKLMGLILTIIGAQMLIQGIHEAFLK